MAPRLLTETPDMVRFITALSAFVVATAALAQTPTTTITQPLVIRKPSDSLKDRFTFRGDWCDQTITLNWVYTQTFGLVCSEITFWSTTGTCGDAPVSGDVRYPDSTASLAALATRSGPINIKVSELPGFVSTKLDDGGVTVGTACGAEDSSIPNYICGSATGGSIGGCQGSFGTTPTKLHPQFQLIYDTKAPTAPIITSTSGTDGTALVNFTINSDAANVQALVTEVIDGGAGTPMEYPDEPASTGHVKIKNLVNNTTYAVRLRFSDEVGNVGPYSAEQLVTPILTYGFWGAYQGAGGTNEGGCSVSWGLMPILAALWFMMRRASR